MGTSIPPVSVNINCNSECTKCCPKYLKFLCFCWCCTCGCTEEYAVKAKEVAEKSLSKQKTLSKIYDNFDKMSEEKREEIKKKESFCSLI